MSKRVAKLAFDKISASGQKKGSMIVMHGLFGSKTNFRSLAKRPEMSEERDVYLLDLRNHGHSEHKSTNSIEDISRDVINFLDEQKIDKTVLLGHSMGGKAAIEAAFRLQDRAEGLIIGDIGPFDYTKITSCNNTSILELLSSLDMTKFSKSQDIRKTIMDKLDGNKSLVDFLMTNVVTGESGEFKWRVNLPVLSSDYNTFSSYIPKEGDSYNGPTVVLYGTKSEYMKPENFPVFKKWFPNLNINRDFKAIVGGHWIHFADPEAFLKHISDFLKQLPK